MEIVEREVEKVAPVVIQEQSELLSSPRLTSLIAFSSFPDRSSIEQQRIAASSRDPTEVVNSDIDSVRATYVHPSLPSSNSLKSHLNRSNYYELSPLPTAQVSMRTIALPPDRSPTLLHASTGQRPLLPGSTLSTAGRDIINRGVPSQVTVIPMIPIQPTKRVIPPIPIALGAAALRPFRKITEYLVKDGSPKRIDL